MTFPWANRSNRPTDRSIWWLLAILLAAVPLRLVRLTDSLWYDEIWSTRIMLDGALTLLVHTFVDLHPPLYSSFMFLWIRVFGDTELAVRLPPLIFALSSIPLSYAVASRFAGRTASLTTALLLCFSPVHIWYSTEARSYALGMFLVLLATYSYYGIRDDPDHRWHLRVYAASVFALVFTHYFLFAYALAFTVLTLLTPRRSRDAILRVNLAALAAFAVFFAIKHLLAPLPRDLLYLRPFTFSELYQSFFNWFPFGGVYGRIPPPSGMGFSEISLLCAQLLFVALFVRGAVRNTRSPGGTGRLDLFFYVLTLPVGLLALNFLGAGHSYLERSLLVVQPFFYMFVARGATGFRHRWIERASLAFVAVLMLATLGRFYAKGIAYSPNPDWKAAGAYFGLELNTVGPPRRIFVASPAIPLSYYDRRIVTYVDRESEAERESMESLVRPSTFHVGLARRIADRYYERFQERLKGASAEIHLVSSTELSEMLTLHRPEPFYLLRDAFWPAHFDQLLAAAEQEPGFEISQLFSVRGITIYKCRLAEGDLPAPGGSRYRRSHGTVGGLLKVVGFTALSGGFHPWRAA